MLKIHSQVMDAKNASIPLDKLSDYIVSICARLSDLETQIQMPKESSINDDAPITIKEAARILCLSRSRVYVLSSQGVIPSHRNGGRLRFFRSELEAYVRAGRKINQQKTEAL